MPFRPSFSDGSHVLMQSDTSLQGSRFKEVENSTYSDETFCNGHTEPLKWSCFLWGKALVNEKHFFPREKGEMEGNLGLKELRAKLLAR